jgi:outer membrane protein assembly factor BamD (BamD/ComL family)
MIFRLFRFRSRSARSKRARALWWPALSASLGLLGVAVTVLGCGWKIGSDHSVRFNPYRTEKEFGRLPPLPKYASEDEKKLFCWDREVGHDSYEEAEKKAEQTDKLWDEASEAEGDGRLGDTRRLLRQYLDRTQAQRYARWYSPKDVQKHRNAAIDKLDALAKLDRGAGESAVSAYLAARRAYDAASPPEQVLKLLEGARSDRRLMDNAGYLEAALRQHGDERATQDFDKLAARYPKSDKREAALFMSAVLSMKVSKSYQSESEGSLSKRACDDYLDEYWRRARAGFERVMREYPRGRYYSDARGWQGRLCLLAGDRVGAMVQYYRMLGEQDEAGRVEALFSLWLVRPHADDSEMEHVERALEREPQAALAYAYHNIYNYAFKGIYVSFSDEDPDTEKEKQSHELNRIASFATRMMNRFPAGGVGAAFVVRVAEANLELGKDADASRLARRALGIGAKGDIRAEALWVAGAAEFRRHRYLSAREALTTLVAENPNNRYTEGARRQLAMLAEDTGDIEGALDQYLALDYRYDVAYFADVLMTTEQLACFLNRRPVMANRSEMLYALGVRYLRDRRWNDAKAVFAKVKTVGRNADEEYLSKQEGYGQRSDDQRETPKERDFDTRVRGIRPQWIDQDVGTANDLERLERQVETSQDDQARAEALYQVASYQFQRSLLFYNPLAWQGERHYLLYDLDQRGAFRQANESQVLFDHMQKHDMAANSLPIFLGVVRRFPNTRAARDALFSAAVCHERLQEYNNYWREVYSEDRHAGERMVNYRDVRASYPAYRFPRGTLGWEPATRTVNGEPGWDKPAKPRPRPSRLARGVQVVSGWVNESFKLWNRGLTNLESLVKQVWLAIVAAVAWVFHWLWILAMCGWLWFLSRRAREARALLQEVLACCKERPPEERDNPESVLNISPSSSALGGFMNQDIRARWLEAACDLEYKFEQVVQHRRGVTAVAFCAATHGVLVILLVRLLVNW